MLRATFIHSEIQTANLIVFGAVSAESRDNVIFDFLGDFYEAVFVFVENRVAVVERVGNVNVGITKFK